MTPSSCAITLLVVMLSLFDTFDVGLDYVSDNDLMIINVGNGANPMRFHTILDPAMLQSLVQKQTCKQRLLTVVSGGSGIRAIG